MRDQNLQNLKNVDQLVRQMRKAELLRRAKYLIAEQHNYLSFKQRNSNDKNHAKMRD